MAIDDLSVELMTQECIESLEAAGLGANLVHHGLLWNGIWARFLPEEWVAPMTACHYIHENIPWARTYGRQGSHLTCFLKKHIGECTLYPEQPRRQPPSGELTRALEDVNRSPSV